MSCDLSSSSPGLAARPLAVAVAFSFELDWIGSNQINPWVEQIEETTTTTDAINRSRKEVEKAGRRWNLSMAATHALHSFWRRHRWTALRSLLLVALLHRLHFLAFLAASSPVWLLTAFLLGAVLVNSEPNVPLAAASEDEDRHLYKKIRRHLTVEGASASASGSSSEDGEDQSSEEGVEDHLVVDKEEVVKAAVAWTADDEHSIQSIGTLELERDARLEKLMSSRTTQRNLIDLDVQIPAVLAHETNNPLDLHHHSSSSDHGAAAAMDAPGSTPSSLLVQLTNSFEEEEEAAMLRQHGSFTAGAAPLAQPSRFKPYFVADVPEGGGVGRDAGSDNSNSSSPSSSTASDHQTQQEAAVTVREEEASTSPCTWDGKGNGMVMAVDVELISDSSDDDMSLDGTGGGGLNSARDHSDDEEDSFEVESITQQVAAGKQQPRVIAVIESVSPPSEQGHRHQQQHAGIVDESTPASVEEKEQREREPHIPVIDSSGTSAGARVGAAGATVAAAPTPSATAAAGPPPVAAPPQPAAAAAAPTLPPAAAAGPSPEATPQPAAAPTPQLAAASPPPPAAAAAGPSPVATPQPAAASKPPPVAAPPQPAAAAAASTPPQPAAASTPPPAAAASGPSTVATPQPAAAPTPRATAAVASAPPSGKLSSKSKVASTKIDPKKAVFSLFRK